MKKILSILALSLTMVQGAWAQTALTPNEDKTEWTLASMPDYDIVLQAEYYTDLEEGTNNSATYAAIGSTAADIWLGRTLRTGSYNSFAAPCDIPAAQWASYHITEVKKLVSSEFNSGTGILTLNFESETTAIEAGKPYLLKVDANVVNPTFDGVSVSGTTATTETTAVNFVPSLGKALVTGDGTNAGNAQTVLFLGGGNTLYNPTVVNDSEQEASYIKGFRAYFQLKGEAAQNARQFVMNFGEGDPTIVGEIKDSGFKIQDSSDDVWYDLNGRKYESKPTKPGVYVHKGEKVSL